MDHAQPGDIVETTVGTSLQKHDRTRKERREPRDPRIPCTDDSQRDPPPRPPPSNAPPVIARTRERQRPRHRPAPPVRVLTRLEPAFGLRRNDRRLNGAVVRAR